MALHGGGVGEERERRQFVGGGAVVKAQGGLRLGHGLAGGGGFADGGLDDRGGAFGDQAVVVGPVILDIVDQRGAQRRGGGTGVGDQGLGAGRARGQRAGHHGRLAPGDGGGKGGQGLGCGFGALADGAHDARADAILGRHVGEGRGMGERWFDQFMLGFNLAAHQVRQAGEQGQLFAGGGVLRCLGQRFGIARVGAQGGILKDRRAGVSGRRLGLGHGGGGIGAAARRGSRGRGGAGCGAAFKAVVVQGLGRQKAAGGGFADQGKSAGIGDDKADQKEFADQDQFARVKAGHEQHHGDEGHGDGQRDDLEADGGTAGDDVDQRAKNGVAEKPAKAKGMRPVGTGHQCRAIDRAEGHGDDGKDHPGNRPICTAMRGETDPPGKDHRRNAPGAKAADGDERVGHGSAKAAQRVVDGRVGGDHPAGIIGRIGHQHQGKDRRDADQDQTEQFACAPFQQRLNRLVQKRLALPHLIGCHVLRPHRYRQSRSWISPRCISAFGATRATLTYDVPGFWPGLAVELATSRDR